MEDFVAWNQTKSRMSSVRSAYYIEWEHQFGATVRNDSAEMSRTNPVWEILWKLQVPSKVKKIVWRALHGTVSGMCILSNRHIKVNSQCPICKSRPEDIRHLIFTCKRAKEVWSKLGRQEEIDKAICVDQSGHVVLEEILRSPMKKSPVFRQLGLQEIVVVAARYIWHEHWEAVKGENIKSVGNTVFAIQAIMINHTRASKDVLPSVRWEKPLPRHYKLTPMPSILRMGVARVLLFCETGGVKRSQECMSPSITL
jgi:hypothetical protein